MSSIDGRFPWYPHRFSNGRVQYLAKTFVLSQKLGASRVLGSNRMHAAQAMAGVEPFAGLGSNAAAIAYMRLHS